MLLALDIGNTNIGIALYKGDRLAGYWRIHTDREKTADEYGLLITQLLTTKDVTPASVQAIAVACVMPPILPTVESMCQNYFNVTPLIIDARTDTGLIIRYEPPQHVGADRIVNAVAAIAKYPLPAVVVDFGTATTFDCVSRDGEYLGGAIAPGIGISLESLFERASMLPRVTLEAPGTPIGKNTIMSIQAGVVYGTAGLVDTMVHAISQEMGEKPTVIVTGGLARAIAEECRSIDIVDDLLTLDGIRLVYERKQAMASN